MYWGTGIGAMFTSDPKLDQLKTGRVIRQTDDYWCAPETYAPRICFYLKQTQESFTHANHTIMKNSFLSFAALLAVSIFFTACSSEKKTETTETTTETTVVETPVMTRFTATLNGSSEKPEPVSSTATGEFVGELNPTSNVLSYTVTYSGLTPTMGHIHRVAKADGTGPPDVAFTDLASPITGVTGALPQSKIDSMVAGQYYVNLHTAAHPAGEIRGDVMKQP